jgi:uncharacterized protein (TIGR02757 family)
MKPGELKIFLENQYVRYHSPEYLRLDPLICLDGFCSHNDLEIAGFVASALAYGRAETIIRNVSNIFEITGLDIAKFSTESSLSRKIRLFRSFKHRFTDGYDIALLLEVLGTMQRRYGSLESLFMEGFAAGDTTIKNALTHFTGKIRGHASRIAPDREKGIGYLLSSPASGSACKRLNMYLRWMVRPHDGIDLGVWKNIPSSKLVIPIDTHEARISRTLGLTKRATVNWTMAEEITAKLRAIDPADPVRFDFSLCRVGMINFRRNAA